MSDANKGPERYISLPLKFAGMDIYSVIGVVPPVLVPFAAWSWIVALCVFTLIWVAARFRLPSYQLIRFFRARMSAKILTPYRQQQKRHKLGNRPWPY